MGKDNRNSLAVRRARVRYKISQVRGERLRLTVFRSARHIYAQIIDDDKGMTLVSASTLEPELREKLAYGGNIDAARLVGERLASKAMAKEITEVVFDRGSYLYHGRTKALAEAARAGGLRF